MNESSNLEITKPKLIDILNFQNWASIKIDNGAVLICKTPLKYPEAWHHAIYAGLDDISDIESRIYIPLKYKLFLKECNGLSLFSNHLNLYGKRVNYKRDMENVWQPYELLLNNEQQRPSYLTSTECVIGGYFWDGSKIIMTEGGLIYRIDDEGSKLNHWNSFETYLLAEIIRLRDHFDKFGYLIDEERETIPSASPSL